MTESTSVPGSGASLDGAPDEVIAAVWAEALGLDSVDPNAGFFDLGATSVTVLNVVRVLRARWPRLQIVQVFANPTVAQLSEFLGDA